MATPILTTIETAIQTAIDAMVTTGGAYNYNWNTVNQVDQALCQYPNAVVIVENEECQDEEDGCDQQVYDQKASILITVRGQLSSVGTDPNYSINAEHNKALDDLKKLFGSNHHISETCDRILYKGMEREIKKNGDVFTPGEMRTRWVIWYRQDRLTPTTAG